jgi:hypothetical protein
MNKLNHLTEKREKGLSGQQQVGSLDEFMATSTTKLPSLAPKQRSGIDPSMVHNAMEAVFSKAGDDTHFNDMTDPETPEKDLDSLDKYFQ